MSHPADGVQTVAGDGVGTGGTAGREAGTPPPGGEDQGAQRPAPPAAVWEPAPAPEQDAPVAPDAEPPAPATPDAEPPAPEQSRWGRLRGSLARSLGTLPAGLGGPSSDEAARHLEPAGSGAEPPSDDGGSVGGPGDDVPPAPDDETRPLAPLVPVAPPPAPPPVAPAVSPWPNPVAASWADPGRRLWLGIGAIALLAVVFLIYVGLTQGTRNSPAAPAAPTAQPGEAPPTEGQPPPAEGQPPAEEQPSPAAPSGGPFGATYGQLGLAGLPLLLGLFWLLSAWLVDAEARRAFVVQEPWGERRTIAYSCLAVGCVFPLILAGLLFAAYGFVSFMIFVGRRQSVVAAVQAGALILLICLLFLIVRAAVARRLAERRYNPPQT